MKFTFAPKSEKKEKSEAVAESRPQPAASQESAPAGVPLFVYGPGASFEHRRRRRVQAKLAVGHAGDAYEQEADRAADGIAAFTPTPAPKPSCACATGAPCATCGGAATLVQRKVSSPAAATAENLPDDFAKTLGSGDALDASAQSFFEQYFQYDFSRVRIHTQAQAAQAARSLFARAFTLGSDIVFDAGEYDPKSAAGKRLLAHELTHVIQQDPRGATGAGNGGNIPVGGGKHAAGDNHHAADQRPGAGERGTAVRGAAVSRSDQSSPAGETNHNQARRGASARDGNRNHQSRPSAPALPRGIARLSSSRIQLQPQDHQDAGVCRADSQPTTSMPANTPPAPACPSQVTMNVEVEPASVGNAPGSEAASGQSEHVLINYPVHGSTTIRLYAVPRELVFASQAEADAAACMPEDRRRDDDRFRVTGAPPRLVTPNVPASGTPPSTPASTPSTPSTPAATPSTPSPPSPELQSQAPASGAPTQTAYTSDGPIEIITVSPDYVVTTTYTKLAVGAASTSVLETEAGPVMIDAGVEWIRGGEPDPVLATATIQKLRGMIGDRPIREVLITHAHLDHINLLDMLAGEFEIQALRINAIQLTQPVFQQRLASMVEAAQSPAFRQALEARIRERLTSTREQWEREQIPFEADPAQREVLVEQYITDQVNARLAQLTPTRIEALVASGSALTRATAPITEMDLPTALGLETATADTTTTTGYREPGRTSLVDPDYGAWQPIATGGQRMTGARVDTLATSYVMELPQGRLFVVPDIRAADFDRLRRPATGQPGPVDPDLSRPRPRPAELGNFESELAHLGPPREFHVWEMGHHMQSGWASSISDLQRMIRFLQEFTAMRTQGGGTTTDVTIVSANLNLVDPANVWLLRSLGMEVFLATHNTDVELINVLTSEGEQITGVAGRQAAGARPADPLLARARAALRTLEERIEGANQRLAETTLEPADRTRFTQQRDEATASKQRILEAQNRYIEGVARQLRPRGGSGPPPAGQEPAAAEGQALTELLNTEGFSSQILARTAAGDVFTDTALVVLQRHGNRVLSPENRRILELRQQADLMRAQATTSAEPHVARANLVAKLVELQQAMTTQVAGAPEATQRILNREISNIGREVQSLTTSPAGEVTYTRVPFTGEIIERRVIPIERPAAAQEPSAQAPAEPTPSAQAPAEPTPSEPAPGPQPQGPPPGPAPRQPGLIERGVQAMGRPLGAFMVIQTIRGQGDLMQRYNEGTATAPQFLAGTVHNALGIRVGLRMARGIHVPMGPFMVMAALDIAQTATAQYSSPEERNAALAYSAIRNGLSLGLTYIGGVMMRLGGVMTLAGFALTFMADPILNALGVYDMLERAMAFLPSLVTEAQQRLRELMAEYRVIVGALELEARTDTELTSVGAQDPSQLRRAAQSAINEHRFQANAKERDLMSAFREAYAEARTDFAGLQYLDSLRSQFLQMQHRAHIGDTTYGRQSRSRVEEGFTEIEQHMSLDNLSAEQIRNMPQWEHIDSKLATLWDDILTRYIDWEDVSEHEREITQMLANARYRLEPSVSGGYRTAALLSPGSPARQVYETELNNREQNLARFRQSMIRGINYNLESQGHATPSVQQTVEPGSDPIVEQAEEVLATYRNLLSLVPPLPEGLTAEAINRNSDDALRYQRLLGGSDAFAVAMFRLHAVERELISAVDRAIRAGASDSAARSTERQERIRRLTSGKTTAINDRREMRRLLFAEEIPEHLSYIRMGENREVARLLGQTDETHPLSENELAALRSEELENVQSQLTTVANRLELIPSMRVPENQTEQMGGVFRFAGSLTGGAGEREATETQNLLVGQVGPMPNMAMRHGDALTLPRVRIVPLNRAATEFFGGSQPRDVDPRMLLPVTLNDLQP